MRKLWPALAVLLPVALGGCVQYPDGTWGPPPVAQPAVAYAPPPGPPVLYSPPSYGYYPGAPVYVVPAPQPPPVVVAPSVGIGIGLGWGRGYWGPGYYGRPGGYWGRPGGYYRRW